MDDFDSLMAPFLTDGGPADMLNGSLGMGGGGGFRGEFLLHMV
jgi:hypothetical protein